MAKMFKLPPLAGNEVWVNPSRVQAVVFYKDHVEITMNIPNLQFQYLQKDIEVVRQALIAANVIE